MYVLTVYLGKGKAEAPSKAVAELPDEIGRRIGNLAMTQSRTVPDVVADELKKAFAAEKHPIVFGDRALTLVLRFDTEQVVSIPLRLSDRDFMGSEVALKGAELLDARLLVEEGKPGACKSRGHSLTFAARTHPRDHHIIGSCNQCGDKVAVALVDGTDIDAVLALAAAERVVRAPGEIKEDDLAEFDRLRRRLKARQIELAEAEKELNAATAVIVQRILEMSPEC